MSPGNSWRHHVIPQFYLRAFTSAENKVHRLEKQYGHTKWLSPRQVGFKANFHRLPGRTVTLEPVLDQHVEHPLAHHHRTMQAALRISGRFPLDERAWLNRMVAHQLIRLPHQRDRLEDLVAQLAEQTRRRPSPGMNAADVAHREHLRMIAGLNTPVIRGIADTVGRFQLSVLRAPLAETFWTGDVPIVIGHHDPVRNRIKTSLGLPLGDPAAQLYFPLAKDLVAVFHHGTLPLPPNQVVFAEAPQVDWINRRILANAQREVYSAQAIHVDPDLLERLRRGGERIDLDG